MLGDDDGAWGNEGGSAKKFHDTLIFFGGGVGRIEKNIVVGEFSFFLELLEFFKSAEGVHGEDRGTAANV